MRVLRLLKLYFAPVVSYPAFVCPPSSSPSLAPTLLPLSLLCLRFRFSFPFYIFLSLSTYLSPLALSPSFILVFHRLSFHLSFRPPLILFFPPFLQSLNNFLCSSRTPTRGEAGLAGGQLPVTPPEAGAGATAALQLRLTLTSPKGAAPASIRGDSTAGWTLPTLGASTAKPTRFDHFLYIFNVCTYLRYFTRFYPLPFVEFMHALQLTFFQTCQVCFRSPLVAFALVNWDAILFFCALHYGRKNRGQEE